MVVAAKERFTSLGYDCNGKISRGLARASKAYSDRWLIYVCPTCRTEVAFEWDDFRDELIEAIKNWEQTHGPEDGSWNYYEQWLTALERAIVKAGIANPNELV